MGSPSHRAVCAHGRGARPVWADDLADVAARLSRHYIAARYPDAHASGSPSLHFTDVDAAQALADAARMLAAVDSAWRALGGRA